MSNTQNALVLRWLSSLQLGPFANPEFSGALRNMDEISAVLARDATERIIVGCLAPSIWEPLSQVWDTLSARNIDVLVDNPMQRAWTLCIARFTRNLVAENPENQLEAFKFEPLIRTVAHAYTSHILVSNEEDFVTTRILIQTISNIITTNEELLQQLWSAYMGLSEEKNILTRTLAHPDDRTAATALVLTTNCLHLSYERMRLLTNSSIGKRLCVLLLDRVARYIETSDESERSDLFSVGWSIFRTLFNNGFASALLSLTSMEGEVVNPQQTTLLKLLDSYLMQTLASSHAREKTNAAVFPEIPRELLEILLKLNRFAVESIRQSLGQTYTARNDAKSSIQLAGSADENTAAPPQSLDVLLPKVCEAIVIVVQCFCTMNLAQDASADSTEEARWTKQLLIESSASESAGLIEELIELLRLLDAFLPRIMFGRASWGTTRPDDSSVQIDKKDDKGFVYLKRDLVRLLGILCYENRAVQDRVRKSDGIPVVMNLCVTDERNPYLREHALFTLRNLLHNNRENQAVVDAIKPVGTWDENGILRDILGAQK